jgi:phosphonate C-P lyase system protein PhnG
MAHDNAKTSIEETLRTLLPVLEREEVEELMAIVSEIPAEVIKAPETGLIMVQASDCFDVDFYLGEILVTTAEVECFDKQGHATVMGDEPMKAVLAATVRAIVQSNKKKSLESLTPILDEYMKKFALIRKQEGLLTAFTRVNFESMAEEN